MRNNTHDNRRKAGTGATSPATRTEKPVYTAVQQETMRAGLRVLARIIARAHLRREASGNALEPPDQ